MKLELGDGRRGWVNQEKFMLKHYYYFKGYVYFNSFF